MKNSWYSKALVFIQLVCIAFLIYHYGLFGTGIQLIVQLIAVLLAFWAFMQFERKDLSIFPDLKQNASFVRSGPYRWIRNPMYTSLLLYFGASLFSSIDLTGLISYFVLAFVLLNKIKIEERQLKERFKDTDEYFGSTYRLIPYIF